LLKFPLHLDGKQLKTDQVHVESLFRRRKPH